LRDPNMVLFQFDWHNNIKTTIIQVIFDHCFVAIYTFPAYQRDKYIAALCQFFTSIKIEMAQGASKSIWLARLTPHGWLEKKNIHAIKAAIPEARTPVPESMQQSFTIPLAVQADGFFQSPNRILDDKLYLRDDIYLLDSRFF